MKMRTAAGLIAVLLVLLAAAAPARMQTPTALPLDGLTPTPRAAVAQAAVIQAVDPGIAATAQAAAAQAQRTADAVEARADLAFNLLGIFETITSVFTLVVPVGAVVLGLFGWQQIRQTRDQGARNREELNQRLDAALDALNGRLENTRAEIDRRLNQAATEQRAQEANQQEKLRADAEALRQAQAQALLEARADFNRAMEERASELSAMNRQLADSADQQRRQLEQAALASSLLPLAERQYRAADLYGARDTYLRALQLAESNPVIHYKLGYVYVHADHLSEAEFHLSRALALEPDFPPALAALGYTYRRLAEQKERELRATADLSEAELSRRMLDYNALYSKAENYLVSALKRSPRLVDEDNESWYGSLGGLYRRRGQMTQAVDAYLNAAEVTPFSSYPFVNLAMLYLAQREIERMLEMFRTSERLARSETTAEPENYYGYADLLTAQLALSRDGEVENTLSIVLDMAPTGQALSALSDTLVRLAEALGGPAQARITAVVERLADAIANPDSSVRSPILRSRR
jgi:tetratricopeptide (TPR) repeat protein